MAAPKTPQLDPSQLTSVPSPGQPQQPTSLAADASPSNPDVLRVLYSVVLKTRLLEEQILTSRRTGAFPGLDAITLGGEATEVGACIGLQPDDSFSCSRTSFAAPVVRNVSLETVFADLLDPAKSTTSKEVPAGSFRLLPRSSTIAGQLNLAAGVALAYRQLGKPNVVVVLAEDGLAALGFWHEAASLASRHRLPIVFMIENPAESSAHRVTEFASDEDLRDRAEAYGFPGITVDGNDSVAVWRVTQESIHRARSGAGPTLVECRTRRWLVGDSRVPENGRPKPNPLTRHDPLLLMEHYMKKRKLWDKKWNDSLARSYRNSLVQASVARKTT